MVHIRNIRQKVGSGAICTVWGKGISHGSVKPDIPRPPAA